MNTSSDLADLHYFLLSNGERVVYTLMDGGDNSVDIDITGKRVNWITEYYSMINKSFPNVVRELHGNDGVVDSLSGTVGGSSATCLRLRGSTRTGLYVLADEGRPLPTHEERDPTYIDLTTCRQFMLENSDRVLYTGGDSNMKRFHERSDFIGKSVNLSPIGGAERIQVRIARELQGQEKRTVLLKHGPKVSDPAIPYILNGAPTSFLYNIRHSNIDGLAGARARSIAAERAEHERFYAAASKRSEIATCRGFLLNNGERVIYVPKTASIAKAHSTKTFEAVELTWNPD
ncbi:hypothetical protein LTR95_018544 [Oleoguttula sp. CCFEE 5521]